MKYLNRYYEMTDYCIEYESFSKSEKHTEIFTHQEQKSLLQYLSNVEDRRKVGILLSLMEGLRLGEICALEWKDIDFENMTLSIRHTVQRLPNMNGSESRKTCLFVTSPKSMSSNRVIPLSKDVYKSLYLYKNNEGYLMSGSAPTDPRNLQYFFKKCLIRSDVKVRNFHVLRHTFATNSIESGMDVKVLSEILGHSDVEITMNRYVHPSIDLKRRELEKVSSDIFSKV